VRSERGRSGSGVLRSGSEIDIGRPKIESIMKASRSTQGDIPVLGFWLDLANSKLQLNSKYLLRTYLDLNATICLPPRLRPQTPHPVCLLLEMKTVKRLA
jgi:hypothetical protein